MSRFLMSLAARLPLPFVHALGAALGWAVYGLSPTYRRHLRENLAAARLDDPATRRAAIAGAGRMLAELPAVWLRPRAEVAALVRRIDGRELVDAARAAGRSIVFLTPHLGCFEIAAKVAADEFPITVLYRAPRMAWLQPFIERGRGEDRVRLARADVSGVRELVAALGRGEAVGILPDQVPGAGEGEWVEYFGKPAYTMTLAAKLAARPGRVCLLAFGERLPGGAGYVLHLRPLPEREPGESETRRMNRALEALIRECPGQYLWGYNRYKRPRGAGPAPGGTPSAP
ncbi:MAG TPA: lysophospholipid acyltransferase family protein [Burkholderiales bacterium]|nr:lysophospholipid acyltransferase family protein [Burkholderiales bacterium]